MRASFPEASRVHGGEGGGSTQSQPWFPCLSEISPSLSVPWKLQPTVQMEGIISTPLHHVPSNKPNIFIAEILKKK